MNYLSQISFTDLWPIIATLVGIASGICTGAIWFAMQSLKETIAKTASAQQTDRDQIALVKADMAICKQDCMRSMVSKEDWVRAEGYSRQLLEKVSLQLASMQGQIAIAEKLPEIISSTVRQILSEIKKP